MSNTMRQLLDNIESNNVMNVLQDPRERQAANLRMNFIKQFILSKNTNTYKKKVERDYSYTVLREYKFEVSLKSALGSAGFLFFLGFSSLIHRKKNLLFYAVPTAFSYLGLRKYYFFKYNKRLFDMCNVGEDTELGFQRNLVLRECNKILNKEDF